MNNYTVKVKRYYEYEVAIAADNELDAIEIVRDFEIEDLEPYEVTAGFEFEA